jgi:hypothetical protein
LAAADPNLASSVNAWRGRASGVRLRECPSRNGRPPGARLCACGRLAAPARTVPTRTPRVTGHSSPPATTDRSHALLLRTLRAHARDRAMRLRASQAAART